MANNISIASKVTPLENGIFTSNHIKVKTPNTYIGEYYKLNNQLIQIDLYFKFRPSFEDKDKTAFAVLFLRGKATKQIKPALKKYLAKENNEGDKVN